MKPLRDFPKRDLRGLKVVLCDIDDTLTWQGRLPGVAYCALENLRAAGLKVVPITGRPAGWCDHIARMWPVDGVVGENGAFYFHYDAQRRRMVRKYWRSVAQRQADQVRLGQIRETVLATVTGAGISADQPYREADLAIDFCEDVAPLPAHDVQRIVQIFEAAGAVAKISSIHVNGWFGEYDKLSMTRRMLSDLFGIDVDAAGNTVAFVGDSPNDAPMFAYFANAVGVANVSEFAATIAAQPQWIADHPGGYGFAEFADLVLQSRK
jgi:HAD superfamily hydrolase (TIGR01484 family)